MELYTLDETFLRDKVIDEYMSAIWTERYSKAGDFQIVLPFTVPRMSILAEGTFITEKDSDELMIIESQLIQDGLMTIKGQTTEVFFNERYIRKFTTSVPWTILNTRPGNILAKIVTDVVIDGTASVGVGGTDNIIPFLVIGDIDQSDAPIGTTVPEGPMYDAMTPIADIAKVGMKVLLTRADPFGYELAFTVYKGVDRTEDPLENDPVRFSAAGDSMANVNQVSSIAGYKTVAYVFPPSWSSGTSPEVVYAPSSSDEARGFDRRVLVMTADDITEDRVGGGVTLVSLMQKAGADALANNNYTKIVDGEVIPQPQYTYGTNYKLGDLIELVGPDQTVQKAQITEYIRSKDATGEKAYPTVSVVD